MPLSNQCTNLGKINCNCCHMSEENHIPNIKKRDAVIILLFSLSICFYYTKACKCKLEKKCEDKHNKLNPPNPTEPLPPSSSEMGCFTKSAVCLDGAECANIGKQVLVKNGTAVDAMLAVLICNGMVNMQSMSMGGGFFMIIYKKEDNSVYSINARETAPKKATNAIYQENHNATAEGPLAIAVPGELKGYYSAHERFGKLPWKDLVQPSIELCEKGYRMTKHQLKSLKIRKIDLRKDENFREWFYNSDGNFKKPGSIIVPTALCKTLRILANNGPNDFYTGELSKMFLEDIKEAGGIITEDDLREYEVDWQVPYVLTLESGHRIVSAPPPASGAILGFIMKTLGGYKFTKKNVTGVKNTVTTFHRIIEVFKYAYAKRSELGDPKFVNIRKLLRELSSNEYSENVRRSIKDGETHADPSHYGGQFFSDPSGHGTSHLTLIAPNGDAVSVTSSLNIYFGAGITSKRTGIVLNSHMDDFSYPWKVNYFGLPGSPKNKMEPGKRPLSSMSPTIVLDRNNDLKMVVGAAGGSQITTAVALTLMRILWFENNIKEAIDAPRIHHQLVPMEICYEYGILEQVVEGLKAIGHKMKRGISSNVCGLQIENNTVFGNADYRKGDAKGSIQKNQLNGTKKYWTRLKN